MAAAHGLATNPFLHGVAPESNALGCEVRQRFFKTRRGRVYRILYVVVVDEVRVLRIRGPGQAPVSAIDINAP
ncbi:MAG: hypothetical protein HYX69_12715 [Planctomycetia bacterium]|nr:hypothetical protein [Planctomycetia bacterium]